ncbi:MAG: acyltransferase [Mesorhizobium sp.]|nr:MAG: acyltransferase [Mesorhizobium sp.]
MVFNVQVMRAIAATLVVWVHTQELIVTDVLPHWLRSFGYGGVDLFFVISGFIMVRTTQNKNIRPIQFYRKRILRVAPLYAFFTMLVVILSASMPDVLKSTQIEFSKIAKSLVFIPFEKTPDSLYPIYYLGWTLNYEMFFYSIFAVALLLPKRARLMAITAVIVSLAGIGNSIGGLSDYGVAAFFYTRPILMDFVLGVLTASYFHDSARIARNPMRWWVCLAAGASWLAFGGQVIGFGDLPVSPSTDTFLRFGIASGLIVAGVVGLEQSGTRIGSPLMQRAGDASYSIYLSHYFFIAAVIALANWLELNDAARALLAPATMAAAVAVGFVTYHLLERPFAGDLGIYHRLARLFAAPPPMQPRAITEETVMGTTRKVQGPDALESDSQSNTT